MEIDNQTVDGSEQNQNDSAESSVDYKAELQALKDQNAELLSGLRSLQAERSKPAEEKPMSKEEYDSLLQSNPQAAIEYALKNKVNASIAQIERNLTAKQQTTYYDQKAESDFPLINKDKKFQDLVKAETRNLVEAGMSKDSPMLVYKAAEYAALKYKGNQETIARDSKGSSGEAPSNVVKKASSKQMPVHFDKMAAMFGLTDKTKERAKEIYAHYAEQEANKRR